MSPPAAYSEERIVEQPAIALFAELGWQTAMSHIAVTGPAYIPKQAENCSGGSE